MHPTTTQSIWRYGFWSRKSMELSQPEPNEGPRKDVIIINRRSFFAVLLGLVTAGVGTLLAIPVLRYILYPLNAITGEKGWSSVGKMTEFTNLRQPIRKMITVTQLDGWRKVVTQQTVFVTHGAKGKPQVLSAICPHLGCNLAWHKKQNEFVCPCHGGRFSPTGQHVYGPPPRGMDPLPSKIAGGELIVHFEYFREDVPNREVLS